MPQLDHFAVSMIPAQPGWRALMTATSDGKSETTEFPIVGWAIAAERYYDIDADNITYSDALEDCSRTFEAVIVGGDAIELATSSAFHPWKLEGYYGPDEAP